MKQAALIGLVVVGVITLVVFSQGGGESTIKLADSPEVETMVVTGSASDMGNDHLGAESEIDENSKSDTVKTAKYIDYSEQNLAMATANDGKAVIFFHANWCPTCRAADKEISNGLDKLPDDVTVLKIDYDSASAMKKQYGVTGQHTFVQVDAEGEMINKWVGGGVTDITRKVGI